MDIDIKRFYSNPLEYLSGDQLFVSSRQAKIAISGWTLFNP